MKRFQVSKFKNASLQESKKELHYSTHPPLSGLDGAPIKAAVDRFALRKGTRANAVIIVPLNIPTPRQVDPEKSITLQAESTISDVDWGFKTSSGRLIATALSSGTVAFYDVPDAFDAEVSGTPFHRISPYSTNVESVLFHPTASSLIASVSADTITLTEFEAGNKSVSASVSGPIDAFDFRGDGTLITTISRDNSLTVIDPRASSLIVKSTKSHFGNKPMRVAWLGNADLIMSTGFSRTREREYSIWDVRNFSQPSHTEKFDVSSSPLIPLYDADTNLVFFYGKGDRSFRMLDVSVFSEGAKNVQTSVALSFTSMNIAAATLVPKLAMDVMSCEVVRILGVSNDGSVVPFSATVPRKGSSFHHDLYPDTKADKPGLRSEEFWKGDVPRIPLVSMDPTLRKGQAEREQAVKPQPAVAPKPAISSPPPVASKTPATVAIPAPPAATKETKAAETPAPSVPQLTREVSNLKVADPPASPKPSTVSSPRPARAAGSPQVSFRFLETKTNVIFDDLRSLNVNLPNDTTMLQHTDDLLAFPVAGPGGRIGVWPVVKTGRLPHKIPCIVCGSELADFEMDPFRDGRVATITEDGYIRVWELPNTGITDDMSTPVESWRAHDDKGGLLKFHRGVKDMLITTCAGRMNELRVWDMATKSILLTLTFSSTVLDMACDPSGKFVAVATREKVVTVFNMRSGEVEGSGASHEGTKGARLCWVDDEHFVSVGFGRANAREIKLFKSGSTQLQALSHTSIDTSTSQPNLFFDYDLGLLFLSAKGDTSVYVFEVDVPKRAVKQVSKFSWAAQQFGCSFFAKPRCNISNVEVNRMWRIQPSAIEIASFTLPRQKKQYFQDDVYPPTRVVVPTTPEEWKKGAKVLFDEVDLKPEGMIALSMAPESPSAVRKAPIKAAVIAVDGDQGHSIMSKIREQQQDSDDDELPQDKQQGVQDSEWDD